jgi:hypothetical protein
MKKTYTLKQILDHLSRYPEDATVELMTKQPVKVVGFVFEKRDGTKQVVEIRTPKNNDNTPDTTRPKT